MAGSQRVHAERLSDKMRVAFGMTLGELRAECARLDAKGKVGTLYHDELARVESGKRTAESEE